MQFLLGGYVGIMLTYLFSLVENWENETLETVQSLVVMIVKGAAEFSLPLGFIVFLLVVIFSPLLMIGGVVFRIYNSLRE